MSLSLPPPTPPPPTRLSSFSLSLLSLSTHNSHNMSLIPSFIPHSIPSFPQFLHSSIPHFTLPPLLSLLMSLLPLHVPSFLSSPFLPPPPPPSRRLVSPRSPQLPGSPQALHSASPPLAARFLAMKVNYAIIKSVIRKVTVQRDT